MAGEVEFEAAARELRATVGGTRSAFAAEHLGTAMDLAMALFSRAEVSCARHYMVLILLLTARFPSAGPE